MTVGGDVTSKILNLCLFITLFFLLQYFETDDPELYKTKIKYIEENDIEGMELTFSEEEYCSGLNGPGTVKVRQL